MNEFHGGFFFGYFTFSEGKILVFMENIYFTSRVFFSAWTEFFKFSGPTEINLTEWFQFSLRFKC